MLNKKESTVEAPSSSSSVDLFGPLPAAQNDTALPTPPNRSSPNNNNNTKASPPPVTKIPRLCISSDSESSSCGEIYYGAQADDTESSEDDVESSFSFSLFSSPAEQQPCVATNRRPQRRTRVSNTQLSSRITSSSGKRPRASTEESPKIQDLSAQHVAKRRRTKSDLPDFENTAFKELAGMYCHTLSIANHKIIPLDILKTHANRQLVLMEHMVRTHHPFEDNKGSSSLATSDEEPLLRNPFANI